ncbi:hypothetical protein NDU88_007122 [Pleurodeles waltl]|uniref:Uncharacterized protein n=1 Tax=Pleurodeles waltl TaxID=8319 RepID=A0AAV7WEI0_PLEWA|nr:hypothetical protein NDU88_007122 [Pleurodeles waltl]
MRSSGCADAAEVSLLGRACGRRSSGCGWEDVAVARSWTPSATIAEAPFTPEGSPLRHPPAPAAPPARAQTDGWLGDESGGRMPQRRASWACLPSASITARSGPAHGSRSVRPTAQPLRLSLPVGAAEAEGLPIPMIRRRHLLR